MFVEIKQINIREFNFWKVNTVLTLNFTLGEFFIL